MSELASRAQALFSRGDFAGAIQVLEEFEHAAPPTSPSSSPSGGSGSGSGPSGPASVSASRDLRLSHNRALVEMARSGYGQPDALAAALRSLLTEHIERAKIARDKEKELEVDESASGTPSTPRKEAEPGSTSAVTSASDVGLEELDTEACILLYNLSAAYFQMGRLRLARTLLEHLFLNIEPTDDATAVAIGFLLLDVLMHESRGCLLRRADRKRFTQQTSAVLAFLERPHALNPSSSGLGVKPYANHGHHSSHGGGAVKGAGSPPGGDSSSPGADRDGEPQGDAMTDQRSRCQTEFLFRLHLYKAKVLLLQQEGKLCKKEVKGALEIFQRELREGSQGDGDGGTSGTDAAATVCDGNFGRVPSPGSQNMAALYAKANLEHQRDNHKKALKLLASCHGIQGSEEYAGPGEPVGPLYYNNMGCLHHKLGRHHAALHYFRKGLAEAGAAGPSANVHPDGHLAGSVSCELLYNTGLQLMLTGQPGVALQSLERASTLLYSRPLVWLRMAECCIAHHNAQAQATQGPLARAAVGRGTFRRILLPNAGEAVQDADPVPPREREGGTSGVGVLPSQQQSQSALQRASRYLYNVLYLCASQSAGDADDREPAPGVSMLGVSPRFTVKNLEAKGGLGEAAGTAAAAAGADGVDLQPFQSYIDEGAPDDSILRKARLCLAYVHLTMHDPVTALDQAQLLLQAEDLEPESERHARTYAAEALCMLGRPAEGLEQLRSAPSFDSGEHGDAAVENDLKVNMAVAHALMGDLAAAQQSLQAVYQAGSPESSSNALPTLVYVLMRSGNISHALAVLRDGGLVGNSS
jgi:CCR4-NOT transcription complex subunit 10